MRPGTPQNAERAVKGGKSRTMIISNIFPEKIFAAGFTTVDDAIYINMLPVRAGVLPPTAEKSANEVCGFAGDSIYRMRQVHSNRVITVSRDSPEAVAEIEADAMVTERKDILLTVWVADCVPVLLAQKDGLCAAAVHAGWRGLVSRIIPAALETMTGELGADPGSIVASVGPAIGRCCYEIGEGVARRLSESCGDPSVISQNEGKIKADLHRIARLQLIQSSVEPSNIEVVDHCTKCADRLFYSRRRGNITERQCGFIGIHDTSHR